MGCAVARRAQERWLIIVCFSNAVKHYRKTSVAGVICFLAASGNTARLGVTAVNSAVELLIHLCVTVKPASLA